MQMELIYGKSKSFQNLVTEIDQFAEAHWPILLLGETGVGKELIARRIHTKSKRSKGPFIPVNCGALPGGLFESELFGFERGAFSGAVQNSRGLVRAAQGGTIFLDEIGELDLNLQVKLLRLLETGEVRSIGGTRYDLVDVRIIAATNVDLYEAVGQGKFRHDLLERLSVLTTEVMPLRERKEDVTIIASEILDRMGAIYAMGSIEKLQEYPWPGNVRQLRNVLIRATVLGGNKVTKEVLERVLKQDAVLNDRMQSSSEGELKLANGTLEEIEKQIIELRLKQFNGNRKRTAQDLGIAKSTLHEKLRKWKMEDVSSDETALMLPAMA